MSSAVSASFRRSKPEFARAGTGIHWALKDVSFQVKPGEVLGVIGRNGAGKSTLLKILSRITEPTSGSARICGRVASLLEVGTGFHAELTGRENVFLNGAILGMPRRDIERKFDDIVQFAEVEKFIDTPVKRYSSGMYLRLAFAVSAFLEPDILIVDEVLAVGDAQFQKKCLGRMEQDSRSGRTVLFVSHNMSAINSFCSRAILLDGGKVEADDCATAVTARYISSQSSDVGNQEIRYATKPELSGQIASLRILDCDGQSASRFQLFDTVRIQVEYVIREEMRGAIVGVDILFQGSPLISTWDSDEDSDQMNRRVPGWYSAIFSVPTPLLKAGVYSIRAGMGVPNVRGIHNPPEELAFEIGEENVPASLLSYSMNRPGKLAIPIRWSTHSLPRAIAIDHEEISTQV